MASPYRWLALHRLVAVKSLVEHALAPSEVRQLSLKFVQASCDEPRLQPGLVTSGTLGKQLGAPSCDDALHRGGVICQVCLTPWLLAQRACSA